MKEKNKIIRKNVQKGERGITLIALIVTVIIMVILAAVSINAIYNMGIIKTAAQGAQTQVYNRTREGANQRSTITRGNVNGVTRSYSNQNSSSRTNTNTRTQTQTQTRTQTQTPTYSTPSRGSSVSSGSFGGGVSRGGGSFGGGGASRGGGGGGGGRR